MRTVLAGAAAARVPILTGTTGAIARAGVPLPAMAPARAALDRRWTAMAPVPRGIARLHNPAGAAA